ncbi:MAG: twin-arginine translocase TatA/TatE family subunit [Elusimicrobia bacterium]|nr:twin-arginine translocase TatA/TatE family subunit [Elusimicrobiota bacterium]
MPNIGWSELLIILAIVLLLFGANRLPDLARSLGKSLKIFKHSLKGDDADEQENKRKG